MNMGDKIKQRRTELNMTQEEVAVKLNVSRSSVANWEAGRNYPDLQLIALIADVLELSLDELLREDCEMIERIAEDTKCRKKQSWKIRVLSLLLAVVLTITSIIGIKLIGPVFMDTEKEFVYKGMLDVESGSNMSVNGFAPSMDLMHAYDNYILGVHFISADQINIGFEFQTTKTVREDCETDWSAEKIVPEKSKKIEGLDTYKINCSWDTDDDGEMDYYAVATGIDAKYGIYVINTYGMTRKDVSDVEKKHKRIVKSFEVMETFEATGLVENVGRLGEYVFAMPGWDTRIVNNNTGTVIYQSQRELSYLITGKSVEPMAMTEENMLMILEKYFFGYIDDISLVEKRAPEKTQVGSAVWASFYMTFDGGRKDIPVLFILDHNGKITACFVNDYAENLTEDYSGIIESIQYSEKYDEQLKNLWDGRLDRLESIDDHDKALALVSDVGFDQYGRYWETTFMADGGIQIKYLKPASKHDFGREAGLLLAVIEPLEYVEVVYNGDESYVVKPENACSIYYGGNIKKVGQDQGLFERYFWGTLQLHDSETFS